MEVIFFERRDGAFLQLESEFGVSSASEIRALFPVVRDTLFWKRFPPGEGAVVIARGKRYLRKQRLDLDFNPKDFSTELNKTFPVLDTAEKEFKDRCLSVCSFILNYGEQLRYEILAMLICSQDHMYAVQYRAALYNTVLKVGNCEIPVPPVWKSNERYEGSLL